VFALSRVEHEDRLSVVDHLDELRTRLLVSLAALAVAFGLCVWQNHALLQVVNKPLQRQTQKAVRAESGPPGANFKVQQSAHMLATQLQVVVSTLERPGSHRPLGGAGGREAGDARDQRAVHDHDEHRADVRAHVRAPGRPLSALQLRAARL
jgi:hypothetical protein